MSLEKFECSSEPAAKHAERVDVEIANASMNMDNNSSVINERDEKLFILKADLRIMTTVSCIYLLSSLDRSDLGNAAVAGMSEALHLKPSQLSTAVSMFYPAYIIFLPLGTILVRTLSPQRQLFVALLWWGSSTACLSAVRSASALIGVRFVIGAGEALGQCAVFYMSLWYNRKELVTRTAIAFSMSAFASSFSGLIAYGVQKNLQHACGISAWQWLFIIEGVASACFSFVVLVVLPPLPEKLKRGFSQEEKQIALQRQREAHMDPGGKRFDIAHVCRVFKDPKLYGFALIYMCANVPFASFSTFLPIVVHDLEFSALETQLLVVPVFACAAVSSITIGILSDRYQHRSIPVMACFLVSAVGYILQITCSGNGIRYGAQYLIAIGAYPPIVICNAWTATSVLGYTKRALTTALVVVSGQCMSVMATHEYDDPPRFIKGHSIALSFTLFGILVTFTLMLYLKRCNANKFKNQNTEEAQINRLKSFDEVCDDHPDFFYVT